VKSYKEKPSLQRSDLLFRIILMIILHLVTTLECFGTKICKKLIFTLLLSEKQSPKLNYFVEIYGFFNPEQKADNRINGGFTYLVNKDFMLDT
jgi:hypothetical protein